MTFEEKTELIKRYRGKSLSDLMPYLAKEWHPTKNGDLTPEMVTLGSAKDVIWFLHYFDAKTKKCFDFEWSAKVKKRVNGQGCPFLTGQAVWFGFNDLETVNPLLALQWHPTKNGGLTPRDVTPTSGKKVWWFLTYDDPFTGKHFDFEWESRICNRANGSGCPYLTGNAVWPSFNDLATTMPLLVAEWHPTKNKGLSPKDFTSMSEKKVWWLCSEGHEWQASISGRTRGRGCPVCDQSKGEARIAAFLKENDISFKTQYRFSDCVHQKGLPFDFAVFGDDGRLLFLIEYDGEHHFLPVDFSGHENAKNQFLLVKKRDAIKNQYCYEHKIPLVRIPYWEFEDVEKQLEKTLALYGLI